MSAVGRIELSTENIVHNINQIRRVAPPTTTIAAVVKANAYGHGVKEVVSIVEPHVDYFQVDDFAELVEIRQYTKKPVLVFGYVSPNELEAFVDLDAILGVYDLSIVLRLDSIARRKNKVVKVHVKVDSLLGRQGILYQEASLFFTELKRYKNIIVESLYSHFSNIEDVEDLQQANAQHRNLLSVKDIAKQSGFPDITHHISATSGFLTDQAENWGGTIIRLGIGLYGLWPSDSLQKRFGDTITLRPVMRWVSTAVQVKQVPAKFPIGYGGTYVTKKPTWIAIIPQGYSDGYDRLLSNNADVLISGIRCPIIGRVAMNMCVADVSGVYAAGNMITAGVEVVLLGKQGGDEITAEELANRIKTINYEVVTRIWPKLERRIV